MAVLRCPIPSFVQDYVKVTAWERVDGFLITPGIISGNNFYFLNIVVAYDILPLLSVINNYKMRTLKDSDKCFV